MSLLPELVAAMVLALIVGLGWFLDRRGVQQLREIAEEGIEPAFNEEISFPDVEFSQAQRLGELVERVVVMRNMGGTGGGEAGEDFRVTYSVFVVDINGATHDLGTSQNWAAMQRPAQKLAALMGVEFIDTSYGTF